MPPEAAQLVVQKIVCQALQNGVPLSEVERKMLLFSETSPTLPDIAEVNETFDHNYDRLEYENKIANLIRDLRSAERQNPEENRSWNKIIRSLQGKDYYFMVMLKRSLRTGTVTLR
jgi:hypothetical protein